MEVSGRGMDSNWLTAYLVLAGAALAQSLLLLAQAWEHRRYGRSCMQGLKKHQPTGRAMVLAPCKGFDLDLEDNLRGLVRQDYDDYEVTFIVESADDPACRVIRRVMGEHPRKALRLLVAGRAVAGGQKVHNLRTATAQLPPSIRYLAFADSDARPRPEWLRLAIARLGRQRIGAQTGYRWFVPQRPSLANHLLYCINSSIMSLLGQESHYLLWGGSWAIRRELFEEIGLHAAWEGTLSDDLVASRALRRARAYVRFEPACVVASPIDHSLRSMFDFIRRQYLIGKYYAPGWWLFALVATSIRNLAWPATLAAVTCGLLTGTPPLWLPLGLAGATYLAGMGRRWLVQGLASVYFPERHEELGSARRFDLWAGPLAGAVNWLALFSSVFGRHITWRGIRYRLFRGGRVLLERRSEDEIPIPLPMPSPAKRRAA
jgi:ceramide glucosyltransferase